MTSIEIQKNFADSKCLQNSAISETQEEHLQLSDTQNQQNCSNTLNEAENEISVIDTGNTIKGMSETTNCNQKRPEKEEEVIILENSKKETKPGKDIIEHTQTMNVMSPIAENDFKINKNNTAKEIMVKGGNNLKRKRRNFTTQEIDSVSEENSPRSKRKKKSTNDKFCWRCHKESVEAHCSACPRSWHRRCIGMQQSIIQNWICGECAAILKAENAETRSTAMAQLSVDQLCLLLKHVVERMREYPGSEPFWKPVEASEAPNYLDYVVKPMDLSLLESNVRAKLYGSTDAFMADAKWIQHNCIVFNTCGGVYADTSKLTNAAKQIIKLARQEVSEIEACPDCYAHGRNLPRPQPSWFIEPCRRPHPLVWAKLKGFPFWPAKAMPRMNSQGFVDVRFFGEHDRAWVSPRDLYLYSEDPPVPLPRKRKLDMEECVREITRHCRKLELVFGQFKFAPPKVQYNPHDPTQIKLMLPNYDPLRSNSYVSAQFLIPKKKQFFKKRLHAKSKAQSDSEKTDTSDTERKISSGDIDQSTEQTTGDPPRNKLQDSNKCSNVEPITTVTNHESKAPTNMNHTAKKDDKQNVEIDKDQQTNLKTTNRNRENVKPSTSKVNMNDEANRSGTTTRNSNESSITTSEQNNNSEKISITKDNAKNGDNLSKQLVTSLSPFSSSASSSSSSSSSLSSSNNRPTNDSDVRTVKQESLLKTNVNNKVDIGQSSLNSSKNNLKATKSTVKVYKPKTRIVDKMNAEKALRSLENEKKQKAAETIELMNGAKENNSMSLKEITIKSNGNDSITSVSLEPNKKAEGSDTDRVNVRVFSTDQSASALDFVINNDMPNIIRKPVENNNSQSVENEKVGDVSTPRQCSKGPPQTPHQRKESKARKSFPNKARNCPQLISHASVNALSNSIDSVMYNVPVTSNRTENAIEYQMLPPEAGPISARLYHGAQDLAKRMARLMEEAYKEAAQENTGQNCEIAVSENHQATVHFLRLQIERMRWEHQQQLAELKHNTDKVLREMKAGLEAERLRAIEETRRDAEEEKLRCIEEIKRKQWCAMCGREALFYCCWNTAYCDYPCQQSHWPMHMRTCAQKPSFTTIVTSSASNPNPQQQHQQQQQQQNHNIKVSSSVGRIYALSHNKLNEISESLSLSCSKEDNGTST